MGKFFDMFKKRQTPQGETAQQGTIPAQQMPQIDTSDPLNSLASYLVTPAEREAQQERLRQNQMKMQAWTGFFDGLRQFANLLYTTKGATPQQFSNNPQQQIGQAFQQEQQRMDDNYRYRQAYANQLINWQRQADQDKMRKEAHDESLRLSKTREEAARKTIERQEEYNKARNKYYEALANKNNEQAEYWRLKAEGVPDETAAKIAKDRAQAQKALNGGGGRGGSSSSDGYETIVTEGYDENGNKVKKTVKQPNRRNGKGSSGRRGSLLPGAKGNNTQRKGSLLPK